jgi:peptidoglycan/LPS O-acetylase OafA/YrhL
MASATVYSEVAFEAKLQDRSMPEFKFSYCAPLDGLRALAVLFVMGYHHYLRFLPGGNVGVDVFFVLSGFLITSLLITEWATTSHISLRKFYGRRALRLLPALLALLSVTEGFALLRMHSWAVQKAVLGALLYSANWMRVIDITSMGPLPHTWSLSVEEQFYLLWPPLLIILIRRLRAQRTFLVLLLMISMVASYRAILWHGEGSWHRIYNGTDTRFDELLMGCAAAFMLQNAWSRKYGFRESLKYLSFPSALFIAALTFQPMSHRIMCLYGWVLIELSAVIIICWLVLNPEGRFQRILARQPLLWMGRISYGLYLWHFPIFAKLEQLQLPGVPKTMLMFACTFAVAAFSYYFIEKPFLRLKFHLRPVSCCAG